MSFKKVFSGVNIAAIVAFVVFSFFDRKFNVSGRIFGTLGL